MVRDNDLWIHQENAVISADSHDIWRFTPEFLVASKVVPDSWICRHATQSSDVATIQIGPVHWRMTREQLWITEYPNSPLSDVLEDANTPLIPAVASNFLEATPYLPSQMLWLSWQISAVNPDRDRWILENFLSKGWPSEFGTVVLQPQLTASLGDFIIQITVRNSSVRRQDEDPAEATIFDCFAWRGVNQSPGQMVSDLGQRTERLQLAERAIRQLLGNGS